MKLTCIRQVSGSSSRQIFFNGSFLFHFHDYFHSDTISGNFEFQLNLLSLNFLTWIFVFRKYLTQTFLQFFFFLMMELRFVFFGCRMMTGWHKYYSKFKNFLFILSFKTFIKKKDCSFADVVLCSFLTDFVYNYSDDAWQLQTAKSICHFELLLNN